MMNLSGFFEIKWGLCFPKFCKLVWVFFVIEIFYVPYDFIVKV